jgi:hypothetical protein
VIKVFEDMKDIKTMVIFILVFSGITVVLAIVCTFILVRWNIALSELGENLRNAFGEEVK